MTRQKAAFLQNTCWLTDFGYAKRTSEFVFFIVNFVSPPVF